MLSIEGAMEVESWTSDNSFHDKTTKKEDEFARVQWPLWDAKVKHKFMAEQTSLVTSLVSWPAAWCSWGRVVDEARVRLFADCTFLPADLAHVHKSITKASSLLYDSAAALLLQILQVPMSIFDSIQELQPSPRAGGMRGLAAGPGAVPVADEPLRGRDQDDLEVGMIIIDDEDDNDEDQVTEAEEPSSRAGQEPAQARVTMVRMRHAAAPPSSRLCAPGYAAATLVMAC